MNRYDLLALFFPNHCLLCGNSVTSNTFVCESCMPCEGTERSFQIKTGSSPRLLKVYSPGLYLEHYRWAIDRFKFQGKTSYARKLAGFTYTLFGPDFFRGYDCISFVPMTKQARQKRGYNQAELYANALSKLVDIPCKPMLDKTKSNRIQHRLTAKERKENVKGVYQVSSDILGQNIILVDDIITTGATMCVCAKLLYQSGAKNVLGLCAADTPPPVQAEG